ncbi:MAG: hypothetical protein AAFO84_04175 [Cyanobacteria bacterium J06598_1]
MVFRSDEALKVAYAERLKKAGQGVSTDVPVDERGGSIDILTDREIIFCARVLDHKSVIALKSQLNFYGKFATSRTKVAVVEQVVDAVAADQLSAANITLIVFSPSGSSPNSPLHQAHSQSATKPTPTAPEQVIYRYPALDSVEGGEGLNTAALTLGVVFVVGIVGAVVSLIKSQTPALEPPTSLEHQKQVIATL